MITINLNEFSNYSSKDVYQFLMQQQSIEFQIIIPKIHNPIDDERFIIFWEYHIMAYTGQKMHEISSEFSYNVPDPASKQPFKFAIKVNALEKLADLLHELIYTLHDNDVTDTTVNFELAASGFFNDAFDNKSEAKTWGLLSLANDYLSE